MCHFYYKMTHKTNNIKKLVFEKNIKLTRLFLSFNTSKKTYNFSHEKSQPKINKLFPNLITNYIKKHLNIQKNKHNKKVFFLLNKKT